MAKLTMHNRLPFDDATAQAMVSTGGLPGDEEVRGAASEAFERYRATTEGVVADYIPALAGASPDLFGISLAGVRGRTFDIGDTDTSFSIQSVSKPFVFALVCESIGYEAARQHLGVNGTGFPFNSVMAVELNEERTMNPMVNAGAIATTSLIPGDTAEEKLERIRDGLSRFAGRELLGEPRRLRVGSGVQPSQPRNRTPAGELRAGLLRPRRGHRRLHPAVLAGCHGPRPGGHGGHLGQRRGEPGDPDAGDRARRLQAGARRDGDGRSLRALR